MRFHRLKRREFIAMLGSATALNKRNYLSKIALQAVGAVALADPSAKVNNENMPIPMSS